MRNGQKTGQTLHFALGGDGSQNGQKTGQTLHFALGGDGSQKARVGSLSRDSAILITLQPGSYTAQVSGKGTATGVALVEVYEVSN